MTLENKTFWPLSVEFSVYRKKIKFGKFYIPEGFNLEEILKTRINILFTLLRKMLVTVLKNCGKKP